MGDLEARYRLSLMGVPDLRSADGQVVDLPVGKPFAVLVILALEPGPVDRRTLAQLLWSRSPSDRARRSVRQALFVLRKALGPEAFEGSDPVALTPGAVVTDVSQLNAQLEAGDLGVALSAWQGTLLEGVVIPGAPEWEQWLESRRAALAARLARALESEAASNDDPEAAVRLRETARAIEPERVERHVALVETLLEQRRFDAAASVLADSRAAFAGEEEALAPLEVLAARLARLRGGANTSGDAEASMAEAPLVGRTAEFAALLARWKEVLAGRARVAILTGAPGIGKTRLAGELAAHVRPDGARSVVVKALDVERGLEWGLLADVVRKLLPLPGAAGVSEASDALLRTLVPSLARAEASTPGTSNGMPSAALADAVGDLIGAVAYESPLLLVVDDLQWADPASLSVLVRLSRQPRQDSCLFLFTCRSGEADPALARALATLGTDAGALRLELTPLTQAETGELFGRLVDVPGSVDLRGLLERLYRATRGNPFYLVEAVRLLLAEGLLERGADGHPRLRSDEPEGLPLPASVKALMDERVASLSEEAVLVAGLLGRIGPASVAELAHRTGLPAIRTLRAADELVQRDVAIWIDHDRLAFTHDELAAAVARRFRRIGPPHRSSPARLVAAAIVIIGLATAGALLGRRHTPPPYGGGTIAYRSQTRVLYLTPRSGPEAGWKTEKAAGSVPLGPRIYGPYVNLRGDTSWYVDRVGPRTTPYVTRISEGRERVVLKTAGDSNLRAVSPDGLRILLTTEDLTTPQYDDILLVADADGRHARELLKPGYPIQAAAWSPDGRMIAADITAVTDTLVLLRPSGQRIRALPVPTLRWLSWCSDSVLVGWRSDRTEDALLRIDPRTGRVSRLPSTGLIASQPACSPDGRALVYRTAVGGALVTVIQAIGATHPAGTLSLPRGDVLTSVGWIPPRPRAVASRVETDRDSVSLAWGARDRIQARVLYSDGSMRIRPLSWASTDSDVASILPDGTISANDPGRALVVASLGGWPADTITVWVTGATDPGTLFRDDFASLDSTGRWAVLGWPSPRTVTVDGRPALDMRGDGVNGDGLMSRHAFPLPRGGTLELEFRLRFTRTDLQRFAACLVQTDTLPTHTHDPAAWDPVQSGCFGVPWGELAKFRPTVATLGVDPAPPRLIPLPQLLPPHGWIHMGLQLRPDGVLTLYLNHRRIADAPLRMHMGPDVRWRIEILDAAVDTHVLLRDLSLWPGLRYNAPSSLARSPRGGVDSRGSPAKGSLSETLENHR